MASEGAPVDMDKIAAIKAAIASGNYPVDADAIAERMIALDLPAAD
jgi:negative regulator of flagellin synthesis FlgM